MYTKNQNLLTVRIFLIVLLLGGYVVAPVQTVVAATQPTILVSVDSSGAQASSGSDNASISSDGRYVAFDTYATNLVAGDTNNESDVFVHDTLTGTTTRISVSSDEVQANGSSVNPVISSDGRYIAFESYATNLVSGDSNGNWDIFVRDTMLGTTIKASVNTRGTPDPGFSYYPSISSDGRYVAFYSAAALTSGDLNGNWDVFVRDTVANTTTLVSVNSNGIQGNSFSQAPAISSEGRYVAFQSDASNLVSGDTNNTQDIFLRDLLVGTTVRVSVNSSQEQANAISGDPSVSADGQFVVFTSWADNLKWDDTNHSPDIFIRDMVAGTTTCISVDSTGKPVNNSSEDASISSDGHYVTFTSWATNVVNNDTNGYPDIFVRDTLTNTTMRVSADSSGTQGNSSSWHSAISSNGGHVAYNSWATNLVAGDSNDAIDIFVTSLTSNDQIYYVKWDATGDNNGSSWTDAYTDLQSALSAASAGDEIWVAAGTYKPTSGADRTVSFVLKNGVAVYGGFTGNETLRAMRDWETNVTFLSGDIGILENVDDNSYHVVTGSGTDNSAVLDGFTIRDGRANGSSPHDQGGGLFNDSGSPTVTNMVITANSALNLGGGVFNTNTSNIVLANVLVGVNGASSGGGMYNDDSNPKLTAVTFHSNSANFGGGMYNQTSSPVLTEVVFIYNSATGSGGGMHNTASSNPKITDSSFSRNQAESGGGIYNDNSDPSLKNVTLNGNSAYGLGGAIYNDNSNPELTDVTISNNSASSSGGGVYNYNNSSPFLDGVTISNNSAYFGGGMENNGGNPTLKNVTFSGNSAEGGGGLLNSNSSPFLTNVTFSGNSAGITGGLLNLGNSTPTLINVVIANSTGGDCFNNDVTSSLNLASRNNLIEKSGIYGCDLINGVDGNIIGADPQLSLLSDNGGFTQTMALLPGSPAIDAGDDANCPATDQRGVTRPQGGHCDIGAYEFTNPLTITGNTSVAGVTLSYTDGTAKTVTSLTDGSYSFTVSYNWSGTVTPTHPCYTFSPVNRTYTNVIANQTAQGYTATFDPASGCANVNVNIGGTSLGNYGVPVGGEARLYFDVSGGPVKVQSTNAMDIVSAIRLQSFANNTLYSFVETMGVPEGSLSYKYYFPTYNNTWRPLNSQLRFGNLNNTPIKVRVTIGTDSWIYDVAANSERREYLAVSGGPVIIESLDPATELPAPDKKIVAAIRLQSYGNNTLYSFSETMGIPVEKLSHKYYFPTYNNTWGPLNSQLRFGNLNNTPIKVRVTIGTDSWTYDVAANSERREYLAVSGGPVIIESVDANGDPTPDKKIIAAIRLQSYTSDTLYSFIETMGVPEGSLSYKYYFPTYNNTWAPLNSQLRFGNLNNTDINVKVTIGTISWTYDVAANSERREYLAVSGGPVVIESVDAGGNPTPDKKIIAAIRLQSYANSTLYSFAETMGIPAEYLSDVYFFPTYNNTWTPLNSQLRFGVP